MEDVTKSIAAMAEALRRQTEKQERQDKTWVKQMEKCKKQLEGHLDELWRERRVNMSVEMKVKPYKEGEDIEDLLQAFECTLQYVTTTDLKGE